MQYIYFKAMLLSFYSLVLCRSCCVQWLWGAKNVYFSRCTLTVLTFIETCHDQHSFGTPKRFYQLLPCEACLQVAKNEQQAGGACSTQAGEQQILSGCTLAKTINVVSMDGRPHCMYSAIPKTCPCHGLCLWNSVRVCLRH